MSIKKVLTKSVCSFHDFFLKKSSHRTFTVLGKVFLCTGLFVATDSLLRNSILAADCSIAKTAINKASKIRGLEVKEEVPCKLQNKEQVEKYLIDSLKEKVPEKRITSEEEVYKILGVIPRDYKYVEGLISLYKDQLAGYYEPEHNFYAMASWLPSSVQMTIAIHELTHALQDQHFDLEKLTKAEELTSDQLLARSALIEGDATIVMMEYQRSLYGQGSITKEVNPSSLILQNLTGMMFSSAGINKAPRALQALLIFPYVSGLSFNHFLIKRGGFELINKLLIAPPTTTEQILHPEKFFSEKKEYFEIPTPNIFSINLSNSNDTGDLPKSDKVEDTKVNSQKNKTVEPLFIDSLGEFFIATLLSNWVSLEKANSAAQGWAGDKLALYDFKDAQNPHNSPQSVPSKEKEEVTSNYKFNLAWVLRWDSEKDKNEFFEIFLEAISKRFDLPYKMNSKDKKADLLIKDYGRIILEEREQDIIINFLN